MKDEYIELTYRIYKLNNDGTKTFKFEVPYYGSIHNWINSQNDNNEKHYLIERGPATDDNYYKRNV